MFATRTILAAIHAPDPGSDATDAELLRRFAETRDEGAFEALVRRHARLVWGVCRRSLVSVQDAEDAFQAAFIVLARSPEKPRRSGTAAGFLFGVARRVALKIRTQTAARAARPLVSGPGKCDDPVIGTAVRELQAILDEEIAQLPDAYRGPFVLCVLEGVSRARAAAELRVNSGTLSSRLARARLLLRDRLAKRGIQIAAALAVTDLAASASAAPPAIVRATVEAGVSGRVAGAVSVLAGPLWVRRIVIAALGFMVCSAVAAGLITDGRAPSGDPPPVPAEKPVAEPRVVADARGDPLPTGAVARLGSTRWRHEGEAKSLSFAPDGKTLAVLSGNDGAVTFFDTATGNVVNRLTEFGDSRHPPSAIAFSPDGKFFAGRFGGGVVRLWDARTKRLVRTLMPGTGFDGGTGGGTDPLRFSPDGKRLAVCTPEAVVTVWDTADGKVTATLTGHNHINPPMDFSPDGKIVILILSDPGVQLWDATTGKRLRGFDTGGDTFSIAVSPDGKSVASGGRDRIVVSAVETGKEQARLDAKGMGAVIGLALTPDGKSLVSSGEDARVRVWDLATKKERFVLDSRGWIGRSVALSADGTTVAVGTVYNIVRVWDVTSGKELSVAADGHDAPIRAVTFSPDGRTLATGGENQQIRLWDAVTLRQTQKFMGRSAQQVSFSPDGSRLVSAWEWGDRACVWDVSRAQTTLELVPTGVKRCPHAAFAPDGKTVVSASWRKDEVDDNFGKTVLHVWDAVTGKQRRELTVANLQPHALAVSPDGKWAALGGNAGNGSTPGPSVRLCDLVRNRERPVRHAEMSYVASVAFSADSRVLAAGNVDRSVRLFEVLTGRELMTLTGHGRSVAAVAFAPGGRVLATADGGPISRYWDGLPPQTIRFWDVATGKELARLGGHGSDVTSLAFSPDGKQLVAGLPNGTALVWETPAASQPAVVPGRKLGPRELAALWGDLAGDEAAVAHEAVRILAASPEQSVPFLAGVLHPAPKRDAATVRQRIADLGSETFAVREAATKELAGWGDDIERELERALKDQPDPEVARRVQTLLDALRNSPPPDRRRELRAVWALELSSTPTATKVVLGVAKGHPDARLTREAQAALDRR
ncbi:sigma-70 family RNA polymerase sigma factor [Frigoriglobus tundricola]|uniref:Uncharacterized protein n=1 Tax=Frigoriglobus tundricola TaxID=2774151 RepID=A0A6M5Z4R3_9BACT|nr:sigma-70 family RNA polymerase sigma factor [Frigoriglobus tundricola]QJX00492.1 hypothetical protein FTUN_8122 [Frigoriglobus tundricola]